MKIDSCHPFGPDLGAEWPALGAEWPPGFCRLLEGLLHPIK